jgi:TfoX/Sxy family transcriptional regulator of competence genes
MNETHTDSNLALLFGFNCHSFYNHIQKMAYDNHLANRVRERLMHLPNLEEKEMMGGLVFMLNDKMCVGIMKDELMCRVPKDQHDLLIEQQGARTMEFTGRPMIGYILIELEGMNTSAKLDKWLEISLAFNPNAKASKRRSKN